MGIEKRIQLIMVSNRLTAASFADRIGVQRSNVSHVLNGRNKPGYEFIVKIIKAFPNVSSHWLLTGEEAQIKGATPVITDEPVNEAKAEKVSVTNVNTNVNKMRLGKKVTKTLVFYDDFTFDTYTPSEQ